MGNGWIWCYVTKPLTAFNIQCCCQQACILFVISGRALATEASDPLLMLFHQGSRPLPDQGRGDIGQQVPTANTLQPDAAQMPKASPQSWQATPVRPQKQAKRSRSQLLATQTLKDHASDRPHSPASSTPKPKSPLRRVPRQKAAGMQPEAVRQLPRSAQESPRMASTHEQGPASPQPRTVIPRPRSPVQIVGESRPDRKRSRSPVSRFRADRAARGGPGVDTGFGAVEPVKNRVLGNDTSFWPGGTHAWPDAPMGGHHISAHPEHLVAATDAFAEAVSEEQHGPSLEGNHRSSSSHQEQQQSGASGNPFGAFMVKQPCPVNGASHTITGNAFGVPFVGQHFPGMPFVPLAPMGIPSPKEGGPPEALEMVVGYPQVPQRLPLHSLSKIYTPDVFTGRIHAAVVSGSLAMKDSGVLAPQTGRESKAITGAGVHKSIWLLHGRACPSRRGLGSR